MGVGTGKSQRTHHPLPSWAGILLVGALAFAAWLFVAYVPGRGNKVSFTQSPPFLPAAKTEAPEEARQPAPPSSHKTPTGETIPAVVNSYIGTITSLDYKKNMCIVMVKAERNYLIQDTEFTVSVNKETVLEERVLPVMIKPDANGQGNRTRINFTDFKVGDEVIVASRANLRDEYSFVAQWLVKNSIR